MAGRDVKVILWNVEWARRRVERGAHIRQVLHDEDPDVICLTEGFADLFPDHGHVIDSDPDYGYPIHEGRRKVLLWSREPWQDADRLGHASMPGGRYVSGVTRVGARCIQLFGVCIPWRDAHVRTGRKDRSSWEDHQRYLAALGELLDEAPGDRGSIVLGDFNQRIPRSRTPIAVHEKLLEVFDRPWQICTEGEIEGVGKQAIDHLAHSDDWSCRRVTSIPRITEGGLRLSDHFGLIVELEDTAHPR